MYQIRNGGNSSIIEGESNYCFKFEIAFQNRISPTKIEIFLNFPLQKEKKKTKFEGFVFNPYFLPKKIEKGPPIFGCNFHGPDGSTEGIGARKNDKSSLMNRGPYIHLEPHVCCAALRALTGHTRKTLLR